MTGMTDSFNAQCTTAAVYSFILKGYMSNNNTDSEFDISALPTNVEALQFLIVDLNRRLKNAIHMVDAQKAVSIEASKVAGSCRSRLGGVSTQLTVERAKSESLQRRNIKTEESHRYEAIRNQCAQLHTELRLAMVDHSISNVKKEPVKIKRIKKQLDALERQQASQKELLKYLTQHEKIIEDMSNAAQHGDIETCRNLICAGADVNEVDSANFLPIHYAVSIGHVALTKLFLEVGSDVTSHITGYSPMVLAAKYGHHEVIPLLVSFGGSVEETGTGGTPPLVAAAAGGHAVCVNKLLDLGADVNAVDLGGNSALHVACRHLEPHETIRILLSYGADTKLVNKAGLTPIQVALAVLNPKASEALGGRDAIATEGSIESQLSMPDDVFPAINLQDSSLTMKALEDSIA